MICDHCNFAVRSGRGRLGSGRSLMADRGRQFKRRARTLFGLFGGDSRGGGRRRNTKLFPFSHAFDSIRLHEKDEGRGREEDLQETFLSLDRLGLRLAASVSRPSLRSLQPSIKFPPPFFPHFQRGKGEGVPLSPPPRRRLFSLPPLSLSPCRLHFSSSPSYSFFHFQNCVPSLPPPPSQTQRGRWREKRRRRRGAPSHFSLNVCSICSSFSGLARERGKGRVDRREGGATGGPNFFRLRPPRQCLSRWTADGGRGRTDRLSRKERKARKGGDGEKDIRNMFL